MTKAKVARYQDPKRPDLKWKVRFSNADGVREEKRFKIKGEAEVFRDLVNAESERIGVQARDLSDAQRIEAAKCFKMLPPGITLTQAVSEVLARLEKQTQTTSVALAVEDLLRVKKRAELERKKSPRYVLELSSQLRPFVATFGDRPIRSVEVDEIAEWIRNRSSSAVSRNNARGYLVILWSHAVKNKWASENPAKQTECEETDSPPAGVLSPESMRHLIAIAGKRFPSMMPGLVIQAFAGLRDAEVRRLTWNEINLEDGHITVASSKAKTRTRRTIDIAPNLSAFLRPLARAEGRVLNSCYRMHFAELRKVVVAEGYEWPNNALRHSFVSYRLTETGDDNRTALEAGHTVDMLHQHYKNLVTRKAAKAWWSIIPQEGEGIHGGEDLDASVSGKGRSDVSRRRKE